jgi:hypothetical protein
VKWPDSVNYLIELALRSVFSPCGLLSVVRHLAHVFEVKTNSLLVETVSTCCPQQMLLHGF